MRVYATDTDFEAWAVENDIEGRPEELGKWLRRASLDVEGMTASAYYDTDEEGLPSDFDTSAAFTEAVCWQAQHLWENRKEFGPKPAYASASLGSLSLSASQPSGAAQQTPKWSQEARHVLFSAGLTPNTPGFY